MSKLSRRRLKAIHFCVQMAADNGSTAILRLLYEEGIVICYLPFGLPSFSVAKDLGCGELATGAG